jgi:tape measure domain-containing protein
VAVDEVVVRAKLEDELSKPLAGAQRRVEQFEKSVEKSGRASVRAGRGFGDMSRQLQAVDGRLRTASASLGQLAGQATRTAAISLGTLGVAAAGFGLKAEAGFERSRIAFGTLLESVEGGNRLFAELQAFNLKTPFDLGQVSQATQTLLQFGFTGDNVMQTLRSISDIAATTSNPGENLGRIALALGQISSAGVLRGQDLNQLVQAGFPAFQLLEQITGQTTAEIRKQMESGLQLPAEEFIAALNQGGGVLAKFASGAEAQSRTLSGVFSNLKDTVQTQLAEAFQPLAAGLTETMPAFSDTLGEFISQVAPPLSRIGLLLVDTVGNLLPLIEPPLTALLIGLGDLLDAGLPGFAALQPIMDDLALSIGELVQQLLPVMPDLVAAFVEVVDILPEAVRLLGAFVPLIAPLANLVEGLASMDTAAAGLLVTLLGYRALSNVVGSVVALTTALQGLSVAQAAAGGAPGAAAAAGRASRAVRVGGGMLAGGGLLYAGSQMGGAGGVLTSVAGGAATGATIGSVVPGVGTALGAGIGAAGAAGWSIYSDVKALRAREAASAGVQVGTINVNNPKSEVDVSRAVAAGIEEDRRRQERRG